MYVKKITAYIFLISLALFSLSGCKKNQTKNPCNGLLNESPPLRIGIMVFDKPEGQNLVLSNTIEATDITITSLESGNTINNWRLVKTSNSPLNGTIEMAVFHEKAGEFGYKIEIKKIGSVSISYAIKQQKTEDPCKKYAYPMTGLKATNLSFEPLVVEGKTVPNIVKVYLQ